MTAPLSPAASAARRHGAAAVAVLAAALGMVPVVSGRAWLVDSVLVVAVVAATGALLDQGRGRPAGVLAGQSAALLVALSVVHAPAQAVWGLLPGPAAWREAALLVSDGVQVVQTQAAPVDGSPGLRLLVSAGAGAVALVVGAAAAGARRPAVAGLPLLAVHAVAVVFAPGGLGIGWFLLALAGFVLLLLVCGEGTRGWGVLVAARAPSGLGPPGGAGPRRPGLAALSVAAAVLAALAAPGVADLRARPGLLTGTGPGVAGSTYLNPLLDLRDDLDNTEDTVVLSYTTDQARPQPLRIVTVDTFTGDVWQPGRVEGALPLNARDPLPPAPGTVAGEGVTSQTTTITIEGLRQQWLPLPYPASTVAVEGADDGDWLIDPDSLNVIAADDGRTDQGQRYDVRHLLVDPPDAQLAAAPRPSQEVLDRYAQLPPGMPPVIAQTAAEVVAGQPTPYDQGVALQDWFRSDGGFTYSLDAPEPESGSALADFLAVKEGYCVHYASTMAVMARSLGIPARVAVGFLPGTRAGDGSWQVAVSDAHAWPELYFEGAGWLRFEPTPASRTGLAPPWTVEDLATGQSPAPTAGPAATSSAAPTAREDRADEGVTAGSGSQDSSGWLGTAGWVGVAAALAGAGLLVPRSARAVASRRRWGRADDDAARAEAAWADLSERVGDLGVALPRSATPRQVGARLAGMTGAGGLSGTGTEPGARLQRLVAAVERSRYGVGVRSGARPSGGVAVLDRPEPHASGAGGAGTGGAGTGATDGLRADALALVEVLAGHVAPRAVRRSRWWPDSGVAVVRAGASRAAGLLSGRGSGRRSTGRA